MKNQSLTIGIDVGKMFLDIHIHPVNKSFRCDNNKIGHKTLLVYLQEHQVPEGSVAALEASGGYERSVWICLQNAGYTGPPSATYASAEFHSCTRHLSKNR